MLGQCTARRLRTEDEMSDPRVQSTRRVGPAAVVIATAAALVSAFVLAGCGGSSESESTTTGETTSSGEATTLQLAADPDGALRYDKTTLEAPAGTVTIVLTNDSSVAHDVAIEGNGVDVQSDLVDNGGTSDTSATLTAGTYTFFCTVPGHEEAGMKGTLTVR
jgi:plastocyanin